MEEIKETDYNRGYYAGLTNAHCDDVSKDKKFIVPSRHIQQTKSLLKGITLAVMYNLIVMDGNL